MLTNASITSRQLPDPHQGDAPVKVVYCQSTKTFYSANWLKSWQQWEWVAITQHAALKLVMDGWTAVSTNDLSTYLRHRGVA